MTLTTTTSRVTYPGTGSAGPFAFPFKILAADDLLVTKLSVLGAQAALNPIDDYSVSDVRHDTGSITLVEPLAAGETLTIRRVVHVTQETSIQDHGSSLPLTIEDQLDRLVMIDQQHQDAIGKSLRLSETFDPILIDTVLREVTAGKVVTGTGSGFTMSTLDSSAVALPGNGRTVPTLSAYLANNAVFNFADFATALKPVDPTGVLDSRAAIQDCIAAAEAAGMIRHKAAGDVGAGTGAMPIITGPPGIYKIGSPGLTCGYYTHFECFEQVFLKASATTFDILSYSVSNGFLTRICGIHFIGGRSQIVLHRGNDDTSANRIERCSFSANDPTQWAVSITGGSAKNELSRCRVLSCPKFLYSNCDQITLWDNWINGYGESSRKPANTASIETRGRLYMHHNICVPEPAGAAANANTRWIDAYDTVVIQGDHFGGENDGFPIVYSFINSQAVTFDGRFISIKDTQCSSGANGRADRGVVVLKDGIPNRIAIADCNHIVNSSLIINGSQMRVRGNGASETLAAFLARTADANHPALSISIKGLVEIGATMIPTELAQYAEYDWPGYGPATGRVALFGVQTGTWTAALKFGGAQLGMSPSSVATCRWTKRGNRVRVEGSYMLAAKGRSTGAATIEGLPFPVSESALTQITSLVGHDGLIYTAQPCLYTIAGESKLHLYMGNVSGGTAAAAMTQANFTDTSVVHFNHEYECG
jgi:hypothetical protein